MTSDGIGLYLHIPFCTAKCGYCDFNSYADHEHLVPSYSATLLKDASLWARAVGARPVETVFFGGGTPSLMPVDEMRAVLEGLRTTFAISSDAEISLEANPGSLSVDYLRGLRAVGFNRLSIGMQSFDDAELRALDRIHTGDEARAAFHAAREAGFDNVNLDFIYGLPEQPLSSVAVARSSRRSRSRPNTYRSTRSPSKRAHPSRATSLEAARLRPIPMFRPITTSGRRTASLVPATSTTRSRTGRAPAAVAATTSSTGRTGSTSASVPAPTRSSTARASRLSYYRTATRSSSMSPSRSAMPAAAQCATSPAPK